MKIFSRVALGLLLVTACQEEVIYKRPFPRIQTNAVTDITERGASFAGEVIFSPDEIIDHGFVWSTNGNPGLGTSEKVSFGAKNDIRLFDAKIERSLAKGLTYYVRAFVKSKDYLVYGDVVSFKSLGSDPLILTDFIPKQGKWSDLIQVVGKNFSNLTYLVGVKLGTASAQVVQVSPDTIVFAIPRNLSPNNYSITVTYLGNSSTSVESLKVQ